MHEELAQVQAADYQKTQGEKGRIAIEIPAHMLMGITKQVVNMLPDYVPEVVKESLISTHTDPQVVLTNKPQIYDEVLLVPSSVDEKDKQNYVRGISILNEIATETLVMEMLNRDSTVGRVKSSYIMTHDLLRPQGLDDTYVGFLQHLHIAYFTGDMTDLNDYIQQNFDMQSIEDYAIRIGEEIELMTSDQSDCNPKQKTANSYGKTVGTYKNDVIEISPQLFFYEPVISSLISSLTIPIGVNLVNRLENLPTTLAENPDSLFGSLLVCILSSISVSLGAYSVVGIISSIKNAFSSSKALCIHEILHYLSDIDSRSGLKHHLPKSPSLP